MTVQDKEKNRGYVAKYRANKKRDEEAKKAYNKINASYVEEHRKKVKTEKGFEAFKKSNAEYMKQYRAKLKKVKEGNKNINVNILQNAFRNRLARKELLRVKQENANMVISNINRQKKEADVNQLVNKLNSITLSNDMMNNLFPSIINTIPIKRPVGRPRKEI